MRKSIKILIGLGSTLLFLGLVAVIIAFADAPWIVLIILSIIAFFVWFAISVVLLVNYFQKKKPIQEQVDLSDVKIFAKYTLSHDLDNPDNFIIMHEETRKIGEPGSEPTPVGILYGKGSELNEKILFICNLENIKEFTILRNPKDKEIAEAIIKISKSQPQQEITETIPGDFDSFGRIQPTRIRTTRVTRAKAQEIQDQKEVEEKNL